MNKKINPEKLKSFARKKATAYLSQSNVNSVGIGYKIVNEKPTKTLSLQFTVNQKVGPESLESINEKSIPESFIVDGVKILTDVIERSFQPGIKSMIEKDKNYRKKRLNPMSPGCSIGHPSISAGTAGCVVYNKLTGEEYILSNWHVLHGNDGDIGDKIVQPGSYDDSRIHLNYAGKLINSHIGHAGDCAVASIDKRKVDNSIIELKVEVENLADPDLGNKVVKSGRTTSVTFGIVSRIHVTTKINYGDIGVVQVGGFEYVPDPANPPVDGEVSMGGDSGSAVMLIQDGLISTTMMGLHFAGEVGNAPEHALACYATSVFEKLAISTKPPSTTQIEETIIKGYNSDFLSVQVRPPHPVNNTILGTLLNHNNERVFDYTHFSLVMNKERKLAAWVSWNIDGGNIKYMNRVGFKKDTNLPGDAQIGNELYKYNELDRGHIARRAEMCWGSYEEAKKANSDSFYYTNIAPQHERFNQSKMAGIWGRLENAVFDQAKIKDLKVSVMAGPLFCESDQLYRDVKIPKEYWKIVLYVDEDTDELRYHSFILTQTDLIRDLEALDFDDFKLYKVSLSSIEEKSGFEIKDLKTSAPAPEALEMKPKLINTINDVLK